MGVCSCCPLYQATLKADDVESCSTLDDVALMRSPHFRGHESHFSLLPPPPPPHTTTPNWKVIPPNTEIVPPGKLCLHTGQLCPGTGGLVGTVVSSGSTLTFSDHPFLSYMSLGVPCFSTSPLPHALREPAGLEWMNVRCGGSRTPSEAQMLSKIGPGFCLKRVSVCVGIRGNPHKG